MTAISEIPTERTTLVAGDLFYALRVGASPADGKVSAATLAAWTRGTAPATPISFYGVAATLQPSGAGQATYAITQGTFTATATATIPTAAATQVSPWGFSSSAQADALVARVNQLVADMASLQTTMAAIRVDQASGKTLDDALRAALVSLGLIRGAA